MDQNWSRPLTLKQPYTDVRTECAGTIEGGLRLKSIWRKAFPGDPRYPGELPPLKED
jgi:hypothetical protein